jgi:NitT/TauT family transport system substrate-binding protein
MQDFVKKNPGTVKKMLRALIKARDFIIEHPDAAQQITANHLRVDKALLTTPWKGCNFSVTLSQSVLIGLGDQARWVLERRGANRANIPNFFNVFYLEGLKSIDPTLVSVGD